MPAAPSVRSETFILLPRTVTDLDQLVAHPERYLVSVSDEPRRAAAVWLERTRHRAFGGDGLVRLSYDGREVFRPDQWDDVDGIWRGLVQICHDMLEGGSGEAHFNGQPLRMALERRGPLAVMTVGHDRFQVWPTEFIPGVLEAAEPFFRWVEEEVGLSRVDDLATIAAARQLVAERRLRRDPPGA